MITINIPNQKLIQAKHLVLDYNGTIAIDGTLISGVEEKLNLLANTINIHVITADTFGKAQKSLKNIHCKCTIIKGHKQAIYKQKFISALGSKDVIAIGNGLNDNLMLKSAVLGIVVIQEEGASIKTIVNADIVCKNILNALDLLSNPLRISATLRN